jgi:hypothetical protein
LFLLFTDRDAPLNYRQPTQLGPEDAESMYFCIAKALVEFNKRIFISIDAQTLKDTNFKIPTHFWDIDSRYNEISTDLQSHIGRFSNKLRRLLDLVGWNQRYAIESFLYSIGQNSIIINDRFKQLDSVYQLSPNMKVEIALAMNFAFHGNVPVSVFLSRQGEFLELLMQGAQMLLNLIPHEYLEGEGDDELAEIGKISTCSNLAQNNLNRLLRSCFYPCFMGQSIGNLYCGESLPALKTHLQNSNIPASTQSFQVYNSTKSILRPQKSAQPYCNASITNRLATGILTDEVIQTIVDDRKVNRGKLEVLAHQNNGNANPN